MLSRKSGHRVMKEMNMGPIGNVIEIKTRDLRKCQKVKMGRMRDTKIKIERVKELWIKFAF